MKKTLLILPFCLLSIACIDIPYEYSLSEHELDLEVVRTEIEKRLGRAVRASFMAATQECDAAVLKYLSGLQKVSKLPDSLPAMIDGSTYAPGLECEKVDLAEYIETNFMADNLLLYAIHLDGSTETQSDCQKRFLSTEKLTLNSINMKVTQVVPLNLNIPAISIHATTPHASIADQELNADNLKLWKDDASLLNIGKLPAIEAGKSGSMQLTLNQKNLDAVLSDLLSQKGSLVFEPGKVILTVKDGKLFMPSGIVKIQPTLDLTAHVSLADLDCIGEL